MTTVVNNPGTSSGDNGGSGVIVGVVVLLVVLFLILFFATPLFRRSAAPAAQPQSGGVQVPSQIDVNVNKAPQPS
ncbi:MAG TPA: hypothetical protein VLG69_01395 [Candidatus Andersenbacteria bacterium]|nr:hypothetical protein [Candidatus Andersenbacteria bacterium]